MKLIRIVFIVPAVVCPLCAAQETLTVQEAVRQAIASRASLKAESQRVSIAEQLRRQAGAFPNPEFQFQNENLRPGQTYARDVDTLAMINQPLDILGKRRERIATAESALARTQADVGVAQWSVARRVRIAYWAARGAQEIRDMLKTTAENFHRVVDYHASQFSVGALPEQDLLRVRLEQERLNISADLSAIDAARARVDLLREMGRTDLADLTLTDSLSFDSNIRAIGVDEALARRPEVKAARAALAEAQANARLQDINARPDLNVTYGYKRSQLPDTAAGTNTAIASVRITLPVTDRNKGNRAAAYAEINRREELLKAVEDDIRLEYTAAVQEFELRRAEVVNAFQPLREHAANISQIADAAYREGGVDLLRVLDAERARLDAELAWARGMAEFYQSVARLQAAEGIQ